MTTPNFLAITNTNNSQRRLIELRLRGSRIGNGWREFRAISLGLDNFSEPTFTLSGGVPAWFTHGDEVFRDERYAHEVVRLKHTGWYVDGHELETNKGIVGRLTHGRFVAGFEESSGSRVYFGKVYSDEDEAAHAADEHARVSAERERDFSERWQDAHDLQESIDMLEKEVLRRFVTRHHPAIKQPYANEELRTMIADLRKMRETMKRDFADIEM